MYDYLSGLYKLGWDFDEHIANDYLGGQDWRTSIGDIAYAPAAGYLSFVGNVGTISLPGGNLLRVRHMLSITRARPVVAGEVIGQYGGDKGKWAHWESVINGVRRPPAFMGIRPPGTEESETPSKTDKETEMHIIHTKNNPSDPRTSQDWVSFGNGYVLIQSPQHMSLLQRLDAFDRNYPTHDGGFLPGEVAILNSYISPSRATIDTAQLARELAPLIDSLDLEALRPALEAALVPVLAKIEEPRQIVSVKP